MKPKAPKATSCTVRVSFEYTGHWRQVDAAIGMLRLQASALHHARLVPSLKYVGRIYIVKRSAARDALMEKKYARRRLKGSGE